MTNRINKQKINPIQRPNSPNQLLVIGTLAFDSVATPHSKRNDILGGSASFLAAAAAYFCKVQMVGIVGHDFDPRHLEYFRSIGADTSGITVSDGYTFRWRGVYEANMNVRHTLETQLNVLTEFSPKLPPAYCRTKYVILGNIDPRLQISILDQLHHPKIVACDTMNYWIEGHRAALLRTLKRVDILLVNDSEARQLSGEHNLLKAAKAIRSFGPKTLIIKVGEHGSLLFDNHGEFALPAILLEKVVDPTGAGDSFAGGMLGFLVRRGRLNPASARQAIAIGTVMASFSVEDFSIDALRDLSPTSIRHRLNRLRTLTQVNLKDSLVSIR